MRKISTRELEEGSKRKEKKKMIEREISKIKEKKVSTQIKLRPIGRESVKN